MATSKAQFPVHGLLPKDATEASQFLKKYPQYDGHNVIIAILDTGVDPGAPGLQLTPQNQPKIVDLVDCTGSGDVIMSKPLKCEGESKNEVLGASGRRLRLNPKWRCPSGEFRVGAKPAFELFPAELVTRVKEEKKRDFDLEQQKLVCALQKEILEWEAKNPKGASSDDIVKLQKKADLDAKKESLQKLADSYEDYGPLFDCVLFHDGEHWQAAIDTSGTGDFTNSKTLRDYSIAHEYLNFGMKDMLNYSVKIYDDGEVLSIVTLAGSHGTHVAAIAAANFPSEPELNGIAPGAQIVSLKIGDTRLGSMETGTGLSRALRAIVDNKCDICNMSYGEDSGIANFGHWIEMLRDELVDKRRVVFVSSAGNAGPALSTVGAPGGTTSGVIGVGAYVTAEMIAAEYSLLENVPERPYTWSSRPPAYDGAYGVNIYAPGAAITSVPQYLLKNSQLMNGTSMSSPNACGNISLLLSAMKKQGLNISPYRITKALENTGKDIKDPFNIRFLQVDKAFEYIKTYNNAFELDINFEISVQTRSSKGRGIYLREATDTERLFNCAVSVNPKFRKDDESENKNRLSYETRLTLVSSAPYVKVPDYLFLNSGGREFPVQVDPTKLPSGFHFAEILAYGPNVDMGPVFKIPVTVLRGEKLSGHKIGFNFSLSSGQIERRFVHVPAGATWGDLSIVSKGQRVPAKLVVHLMQMVPKLRHTRTESEWYFSMNGEEAIPKKSFKVLGGYTLEVCVAQFWSSLGANDVELSFEFHGVGPSSSPLILNATKTIEKVTFISTIGQENAKLSASLDSIRKSLRPSSHSIAPLKSRDVLLNGKQLLELILTYQLEISEASTVVVRKPILDDILYDSAFDSSLIMIESPYKKMLNFGDIYPKPVKLVKGTYSIKVQIRHELAETLESLKDLALLVDVKLSKPCSLEFFENQVDILYKKKNPVKSLLLEPASQTSLYCDCAIELPKEAKTGDFLVGELTCGQGTTPLELSVLALSDSKDNDKPNDKPPSIAEMEIYVIKSKLAFVKQLAKPEEQEKLYESLLSEHPNDELVLNAKLEYVAASQCSTESDKAKRQGEIVTLAEKLLSGVNEVEVMKFLSENAPSFQTDEYKKKKKEFDEKKKNILNWLYRKAEALLCVAHQEQSNESIQQSLETVMIKLESICDFSEARMLFLRVAYYNKSGMYGLALKPLLKFIDDQANSSPKPIKAFSTFLSLVKDENKQQTTFLYLTSDVLQCAIEWKQLLLKKLGWDSWVAAGEHSKLIQFPQYKNGF